MDALFILAQIYVIGCWVAFLGLVILNLVADDVHKMPFTWAWSSWVLVWQMATIFIKVLKRRR